MLPLVGPWPQPSVLSTHLRTALNLPSACLEGDRWLQLLGIGP
jgi:hypothetical protein